MASSVGDNELSMLSQINVGLGGPSIQAGQTYMSLLGQQNQLMGGPGASVGDSEFGLLAKNAILANQSVAVGNTVTGLYAKLLTAKGVTPQIGDSQFWMIAKTTPAAGLPPPSQASGAGFRTLVFSEDCQKALDIGFGTQGYLVPDPGCRKKWTAGFWYEASPAPSAYVVSNGVLTITGGASSNANLCTQFHDGTGGAYFQGGYFEAMMQCTDWSAFWLYASQRPWVNGANSNLLAGNPLTWTAEIDIAETDQGPTHQNQIVGNVHKNSGSDVVADATAPPTNIFTMPSGGSPFGQWHTYGLLWTPTALTWYVDNIQVATAAPYASTPQSMQLAIAAQPGGVQGGATVVNPPTTKVQWVRVWG
jgi:hypothetical protein